MSPTTVARLQVLGAAALFSTGGAVIKSCSLSGIEVAGWRSAVAAVMLASVLRWRAGASTGAFVVAFFYAVTLVGFVAANKLTTAANSIFLQDTAPLYVMLVAPALLGEHLRRSDVPFLAMIAVGMGLFFVGVEQPSVTAPEPFLGNVIAATTGASWAGTLLGLRWLGLRGANREAGAFAVVAGNAAAFLVCLPWLAPSAVIWPGDATILLYLGVFQVGLAYVLLTRAAAGVPALELALLLLLEPVLNPVWAALVHGEVPSAWAVTGGILVLAATTLRTLRRSATTPG